MSAPRSKQFDDVYFSAQDGLAETRHVFLDGNDLLNQWVDRDRFLIGETGFGTGLNFLAVWALFDCHRAPDQHLHFISVEKYPLSVDEVYDALSHWPELDLYRDQLVSVYPDACEGVFHHDFGAVSLSVYFDDVLKGLSQYPANVDAWFLDGFRPSSNLEMWTEDVFKEVARLSQSETRFATFTSAGFVRRGLESVGFDVKKVPGFGRKREMSVGVLR
ncbi:MAG: tRNA (5-methylaminomethyl-2-thiouridine)(34)-methyltransferase MnmD [Bdellovibrionales bacterium]